MLTWDLRFKLYLLLKQVSEHLLIKHQKCSCNCKAVTMIKLTYGRLDIWDSRYLTSHCLRKRLWGSWLGTHLCQQMYLRKRSWIILMDHSSKNISKYLNRIHWSLYLKYLTLWNSCFEICWYRCLTKGLVSNRFMMESTYKNCRKNWLKIKSLVLKELYKWKTFICLYKNIQKSTRIFKKNKRD